MGNLHEDVCTVELNFSGLIERRGIRICKKKIPDIWIFF